MEKRHRHYLLLECFANEKLTEGFLLVIAKKIA